MRFAIAEGASKPVSGRSRIAWISAGLLGFSTIAGCGASSQQPPQQQPKSGAQSLPPERQLLGATTIIDYQSQAAVALGKPVNSGPGYAEIVGNLSYASLLKSYTGAVIGDLHVDIVFTNNTTQTIRVTELQISQLHASSQPFAGTFIPVAHQGGTTAFEFTADMDSPDPVIKPRSGGQPFPDFNLQIAPGEQDTTAVSFLADSGSFTWSLTVTYLIGTQSYKQRINQPGGQSFAVTAPAAKYSVEYQVVPFAGLQLVSPS
jgi:hypothetical protein